MKNGSCHCEACKGKWIDASPPKSTCIVIHLFGERMCSNGFLHRAAMMSFDIPWQIPPPGWPSGQNGPASSRRSTEMYGTAMRCGALLRASWPWPGPAPSPAYSARPRHASRLSPPLSPRNPWDETSCSVSCLLPCTGQASTAP